MERSHTLEAKYHLIAFIDKYSAYIGVETANNFWLEGVWGRGFQVSIWAQEKVLKLNSGDSVKASNTT